MPAAPSMTVIEAMGSMPQFIASQLGDRALDQCLYSAGLPSTIANESGSFVPEIAMDRFIERAARVSGNDLFGLELATHLSVKEYGAWGDYVLEASDLFSALRRASSTIHLHANNDKLVVRGDRKTTRVEYIFGERAGKGYKQIVLAALGPMLSIPRYFHGEAWKPLRIDLDVPDRPTADRIERALNCQVRLSQCSVAIEIPNNDLGRRNPAIFRTYTTRHDVERACRGGPPRAFVSAVQELILQRLGVDSTTLDDIARSMAISRRTLQRRLDEESTNFRGVIEAVKIHRAEELLIGSRASISEISAVLDYSTASHFARAFRKAHGRSPLEFRDASTARLSVQ